LAVDETGLIAGFVGHTIGFADGTALQTNAPPELEGYAAGSVTPNVGSLEGAPKLTFGEAILRASRPSISGTSRGSTRRQTGSPLTVTSPAHVAGPVDVTVQTTAGYVTSAYFGFSYGPSISMVLTPSSMADGEGIETILGYGTHPRATPRNV